MKARNPANTQPNMTFDLKKAFNRKNLERCWLWLNTNSDNNYKAYFRTLYQAFALALDENLDKLHRDLINHRYKPELSIKLYSMEDLSC